MKQYIFNFNWLFLDKVIKIIGGLFIGAWVARSLGPENYGILSYSMAFVLFFSFLSSLGLNQIVVKKISKNEIPANEIIATTFYLKLYGGLFALISGTLFVIYLHPENNTMQIIVILLLSGYLFQSLDSIDYYFQAKVISKFTVIARSSAFVFSNILKIYFIIYEYNVIYFSIAIFIDYLLVSLFLFLIYFHLNLKVSRWKFNSLIAKELLKDSWPLMLSSFFIIIYMRIDQIMIEKYLDMHSVGLYSVAVQLAEAWYFIPTIIISTLMPYFIKMKDLNRKLYLYRLKQINTFMFWMGVFIGIFFTLFGMQIIVLMFGEEYKEAYIALSLNIWTGIFISIGLTTSLWIIAENLQLYRLIGTAIGVILNIIGNYILIPTYGIAGAAIATLITQGLGLWVVPLLFKPTRGYTIMSIITIVPVFLIKGMK